MKKSIFGYLPTGEAVECCTLQSDVASVEIITWGAAIRNLRVFGHRTVGGFDTLEAYLKDDNHHGAVIGRVANRIAGGKFTLDGVEYTLVQNNGQNCLHGGTRGFDRRLWAFKDDLTTCNGI